MPELSLKARRSGTVEEQTEGPPSRGRTHLSSYFSLSRTPAPRQPRRPARPALPRRRPQGRASHPVAAPPARRRQRQAGGCCRPFPPAAPSRGALEVTSPPPTGNAGRLLAFLPPSSARRAAPRPRRRGRAKRNLPGAARGATPAPRLTWMNWMVSADLPTPPPPTTTSRYFSCPGPSLQPAAMGEPGGAERGSAARSGASLPAAAAFPPCRPPPARLRAPPLTERAAGTARVTERPAAPSREEQRRAERRERRPPPQPGRRGYKWPPGGGAASSAMLMNMNIHMRGAWPRPPACSSRSRRAALSPLRRGSGPRSPLAALGLAAARPAVPRSSEPRVWELPSPPRHHHGVTAASERSAQRNSSALLLPKFGLFGVCLSAFNRNAARSCRRCDRTAPLRAPPSSGSSAASL